MYRVGLIHQALQEVLQDFIGISLHPLSIIIVLFYVGFVFLLFALMYGVGSLIDRRFFAKTYHAALTIFIRIALGYLVVTCTLFLLGFLHLLYVSPLAFVFLVFLCIALWQIQKERKPFSFPKKWFAFEPMSALCIIVISIGFFRLLPPAAAGDSIDYHVTFPRIYLFNHTMMLPPVGNESYSMVPHLPDLLYIFSELMSNGEAARYIHFGFFLVVFFLLWKVSFFAKNHVSAAQFTALLFISAPLMLHIGTASFSDFPAVLCLLLCLYLFTHEKLTIRSGMLCGLLLGGYWPGRYGWLSICRFFFSFFWVLLFQCKR